MKKKLLHQFITVSYTDNRLDEKMVLTIADKLGRSDLKKYIRALKLSIKQRSISIDAANTLTKTEFDGLKTVFPDKKLLVHQNSSLLVGIRIVNNDDVIELNLKHELNAIIEHITS